VPAKAVNIGDQTWDAAWCRCKKLTGTSKGIEGGTGHLQKLDFSCRCWAARKHARITFQAAAVRGVGAEWAPNPAGPHLPRRLPFCSDLNPITSAMCRLGGGRGQQAGGQGGGKTLACSRDTFTIDPARRGEQGPGRPMAVQGLKLEPNGRDTNATLCYDNPGAGR